jgi:glycosyltransferase involved in cell wall biosynthesis
MRITILTPYFPPEMGAPPARLYELGVRLKAFGHEVSVVTALPNRPHGKVFDGYRGKFRMIEDMDGLRVIRTWIKPSASSSTFIHRLITDLSFTWSSGCTTARLLGKQDVLIVQNPPIFSGISARRLKKKTGALIVMWCGDVWPEVLVDSGQLAPGILAKTMHRVQQRGFSHSDLLAVTNPAVAKDTQYNYCCPPVTVWSNGIDTELFSPDCRNDETRADFGVGPDDILVGYVGLHGRFQGLDVILDAATLLRDRKNIRFAFIGEGVEKQSLVAKAEDRKLSNVEFYDPRPKSEMPAIVSSCDLSVVSLVRRMPGTMPSKFYEALASGSISLVADGCEAAHLVREHDVGVLYEPTDAESAADAIRQVASMGVEERNKIRGNARELSKRFERNRLAEFVNDTLIALGSGQPLPEIDW